MESEVVQLPLSEKLWAWFQEYQKQAIWGVSLIAAASLIFWFIIYRQGQAQAEASAALSDVTVAQLTGARTDAAEAYGKVASAYPNSKAGARALLLTAGNLFTEGKYEEAKGQFQKFTREHRDSPFMGEALLGIAACLEAQGKTADAMTAYTELVQRHSGETVIPRAKLALGRLYEGKNPEQARKYYEEAAAADPSGSVGDDAGMRLQDLLVKHPNLAPVAKAPAIPVPSTTPTPANKPGTNAAAPQSSK